jgi:predicted HAD superfamily Cof-like phosphohydrolase
LAVNNEQLEARVNKKSNVRLSEVEALVISLSQEAIYKNLDYARYKRNKMKNKLKSVAEFHEIFQIGNADKLTILDEANYTLRYNLLKEENEEYLEAAKREDLVEIADALGDQLYILCGTILKHGLQHKIEEVFDEIHRSNMSKLDENGKPIFREDGKVLKSNLYFRPDIKRILDK